MALAINFSGHQLEVGTDEAGRGCLAGPVVAAAVILPENFEHPFLNDSKKLSEKQRKVLLPIIEKEAVAFAIAFVDQQEIDKINILQASITAMHRSIDKLSVVPTYIIVDGNKFRPYKNIPSTTIVKGDGKYLSIAAASVLAKTYRDVYMEKIHKEFPEYNWQKNKGYPTKAHRQAIAKIGSCHHHRQTFKLLTDEQLSLFKDSPRSTQKDE